MPHLRDGWAEALQITDCGALGEGGTRPSLTFGEQKENMAENEQLVRAIHAVSGATLAHSRFGSTHCLRLPLARSWFVQSGCTKGPHLCTQGAQATCAAASRKQRLPRKAHWHSGQSSYGCWGHR
jgi:hypothetical protein